MTELERIEAVLTELERPSVIRAAIRAAGDPDMEWWNKGWTAAVKRMRAAFDGDEKQIERQEDLLTKAQRPTAADMAKQITAQAPRIPTHCCPACGALWIEYTDSWSLWSMTCGKCCDNPPSPPTLLKVRPAWSQSDAEAKQS